MLILSLFFFNSRLWGMVSPLQLQDISNTRKSFYHPQGKVHCKRKYISRQKHVRIFLADFTLKPLCFGVKWINHWAFASHLPVIYRRLIFCCLPQFLICFPASEWHWIFNWQRKKSNVEHKSSRKQPRVYLANKTKMAKKLNVHHISTVVSWIKMCSMLKRSIS